MHTPSYFTDIRSFLEWHRSLEAVGSEPVRVVNDSWSLVYFEPSCERYATIRPHPIMECKSKIRPFAKPQVLALDYIYTPPKSVLGFILRVEGALWELNDLSGALMGFEGRCESDRGVDVDVL